MAPRFADLESRVSGAVFAHLSNAVAIFDGGREVAGIFDQAYALSNVGIGMAGVQPVFTTATAEIVGEAVGQTLWINSMAYVVAAHEPDGTGISRLLLEALV